MIQSPDDRRTPITPQLALRVAIIGGLALAMFGIIFFRLWFLQVLSGDQYLAQAQVNRVRDLPIAARRGELLDRNGNVLVGSRLAEAVVISPPLLPPTGAARERLYVRLSHVLGISAHPQECDVSAHRHPRVNEVRCLIEKGVFQVPYADVTIQPDAAPAAYSFLGERAQEFPGVSLRQVYLRSYPLAEVGAQVFGTVGQINASELHDPQFRGVRGGTVVGQSGIERVYDHYLRGVDGASRVQVDALGRAKGYLGERAPVDGNNLKLSLDMNLEKAGQAALKTGIGLAAANGARAGAFVALDPRNGAVLAMGSEPSFDPTVFTHPVSDAHYKALFGNGSDFPQLNRAIEADYPVGSTFKVVTAAAALATGILTPDTPYTDTGSFRIGTQVRRNAGGASYGTVTLVDAIRFSVDTFFYHLGQQLNADPVTHPDGGQLQAWARRLGLGAQTGIDLADEHSGTIPSQRWRDMRDREERACRKRNHGQPCGLSDFRNWTVGDNVSLAVGQGDFLATPLQMAVVYAAIENNGTIVKPHVGLQVTDRNGRVLQTIDPKPSRHVTIPDLPTIQQGLYAAANESGGTSADVFQGFPSQYQVHGKTGTASFSNKPDQSWYVAYVPDPVKPIVVAATIENGGFGASAAAPAVRLILSQWFGVKKQVVTGKSQTL